MSSQDQELKDQVCFFICKAVKLMEQNIKWVVKLYNNKLVTTMTHWQQDLIGDDSEEKFKPYPNNTLQSVVCIWIGIKWCDE